MKFKTLLIAAALAGVSTSAFAITTVAPADAAVKFEAPVPAKIIQPVVLPARHNGSEITLTMDIDANGKPSNVRVVGTRDQQSYKQLLKNVAQWRFTPARKNGQAVPSKVELPLEVRDV